MCLSFSRKREGLSGAAARTGILEEKENKKCKEDVLQEIRNKNRKVSIQKDKI